MASYLPLFDSEADRGAGVRPADHARPAARQADGLPRRPPPVLEDRDRDRVHDRQPPGVDSRRGSPRWRRWSRPCATASCSPACWRTTCANPLGAITTAAQPGADASGGRRRPQRQAAEQDRGERPAHGADDRSAARLHARAGLRRIEILVRDANLADLCSQAIGEVELVYPDRSILCSFIGDQGGTWDPDRLLQIISNLVANACQHGRARQPGDGPARRPAARRRLARGPQTRGRSRRRCSRRCSIRSAATRHRRDHARGLGLGPVSSSRSWSVRHGGSVEVNSTEPDGTTFTIRPAAAGRRRSALGGAARAQPLTTTRCTDHSLVPGRPAVPYAACDCSAPRIQSSSSPGRERLLQHRPEVLAAPARHAAVRVAGHVDHLGPRGVDRQGARQLGGRRAAASRRRSARGRRRGGCGTRRAPRGRHGPRSRASRRGRGCRGSPRGPGRRPRPAPRWPRSAGRDRRRARPMTPGSAAGRASVAGSQIENTVPLPGALGDVDPAVRAGDHGVDGGQAPGRCPRRRPWW